MAENTTQTPEVVIETTEVEETPNRLQVFVNNHPRAAKAIALVGAVTAAGGVVHFTRTVKANREHLELAADHAKEALNELATTASPTQEQEA